MIGIKLPEGFDIEAVMSAGVVEMYEVSDPGMCERLIALRKSIVAGAESYAEALMGSAGFQACEPLATLCEAISDLSRVIGYLDMDQQRERMAKQATEQMREQLRRQGLPVDEDEIAARLAKQPKHA